MIRIIKYRSLFHFSHSQHHQFQAPKLKTGEKGKEKECQARLTQIKINLLRHK
jgi:hypothetical protein